MPTAAKRMAPARISDLFRAALAGTPIKKAEAALAVFLTEYQRHPDQDGSQRRRRRRQQDGNGAGMPHDRGETLEEEDAETAGGAEQDHARHAAFPSQLERKAGGHEHHPR